MSDDLTDLTGVGPKTAEALEEVGFETTEGVLNADVDELTEAEYIGESTGEAILEQEMSGYKGRPKKLADKKDDIHEAAERGLTYEGIARVAGVGSSTLREWRNDYPEFEAELQEARARGEQKLIERVAEDKPEFILERSYDYIKTEKREIDADVDQTTTHSLEGVAPDDVREFLRYRREKDGE